MRFDTATLVCVPRCCPTIRLSTSCQIQRVKVLLCFTHLSLSSSHTGYSAACVETPRNLEHVEHACWDLDTAIDLGIVTSVLGQLRIEDSSPLSVEEYRHCHALHAAFDFAS